MKRGAAVYMYVMSGMREGGAWGGAVRACDEQMGKRCAEASSSVWDEQKSEETIHVVSKGERGAVRADDEQRGK